MRSTWVALAMAFTLAAGVPAIPHTAFAQSAGTSTQGNRPVAPPTATPSTSAALSRTVPSTGLVNINTATEKQLDTIPQIGPKRAAAIIKNRPYRSIDDLVTKKALSKGIFEKVKSHVTV